MPTTHAVGIDLGTTYSCIAHLNEHGEPVSIVNEEGEISTPSVVMIDQHEEIVGTEAMRNSILHPGRVIQNAKRYMGDPRKTWVIDNQVFTPIDASAAILKKLLGDAQRQIGKIERAVITVPAQFSDLQRQATIEAGKMAGLKQVDIINEPVAAALCYVLGTEGLWFTELANEQRILVYDLGGGTFDLSLVSYQQNEVRVIASGGDLFLGGIDWNQALLNAVAEQFAREFKDDPRKDPESLQHLAWEVEQCKRSLTVRSKASLICQHAGKRKTYQIQQEQFAGLTKHLVTRSEEITQNLLKDNKMGWAHVDVVLSTGGSSRMPMVRDMLKRLGGRTLNTSLSPDQSIAHGATYYAGMLLTNSEFAHSILNAEATARLSQVKQQSVNARGLGILIRDVKSRKRVPFYLIPANTPLPASSTHTFGTVIANQNRVHLRIVESGAGTQDKFVELGTCEVNGLPPKLPVDSEIAVTISYDASARVHVTARDVSSGKEARTEIIRAENLVNRAVGEKADDDDDDDDDAVPILAPVGAPSTAADARAGQPSFKAPPAAPRPVAASAPAPAPVVKSPKQVPLPPALQKGAPQGGNESSSLPIPLCNHCGQPLNSRGECAACGTRGSAKPVAPKPVAPNPGAPTPSMKPTPAPSQTKPSAPPSAKPAPRPVPPPAKLTSDSVILKPLNDSEIIELPPKQPAGQRPMKPSSNMKPSSKGGKDAGKDPSKDPGEEEFWKMTEQ